MEIPHNQDQSLLYLNFFIYLKNPVIKKNAQYILMCSDYILQKYHLINVIYYFHIFRFLFKIFYITI